MTILYTDIGHKSEDDLLWIIIDWEFRSCRNGGMTHKWVYGMEVDHIESCWRGRFEVETGRCSVLPPSNFSDLKRLPSMIKDILTSEFYGRGIKKIIFINRDVEEISPNPRKAK